MTIPDSVKSIASSAFKNCSRLTKIYFEGDAPQIEGQQSFVEVPEICTVYVSRRSSGWNVEIPGTWCGLKIDHLCTHKGGEEDETSVINAQAATCTKSGYTGDKVCSRCGIFVEAGETIPAVGHQIGDGVVTIESTGDGDVLMTYYCTRCGDVMKTEPIRLSGWRVNADGVLTDVVIRGATELTVPYGVKSIGAWAFYGCSGLTSVKIPNSVTSIGSYAF